MASPNFPSVVSAFQEWMEDLEGEQELKENIRVCVRELEAAGRELASILQKIHQTAGFSNLGGIVKASEDFIESKVKNLFGNLASAVPDGQYYRYHTMYNVTIQRYVFQLALTHYLKNETLLSFADCAKALGVEASTKSKSDAFHLDLEDYLAGIIQVSNELSRFVVNSVTHGDYVRPKRISTFLNDVNAGFRLLNLKNDILRKKFDSLKYDLKKVEEVVYDLSIRGLLKTDEEEAPV